MFTHSGNRPERNSMKRFAFVVCLAILFILAQAGITSADTGTDNTTMTGNMTITATTTVPERTGGTIYFETLPTDATIWLDNVNIGTSTITYFSEKTGTLDVRVQKKGYEDYMTNVTITDGKRTNFYARLTPVKYELNTPTPTAPVTTVTTIRRSTMAVPTSWPTPTPESPAEPAVVIGAAAVGIGLFAIRRR
jgi:hypothetical protein